MNDTEKVLVSQLTSVTNKPLVQENSENKSYTGSVLFKHVKKRLFNI